MDGAWGRSETAALTAVIVVVWLAVGLPAHADIALCATERDGRARLAAR